MGPPLLVARRQVCGIIERLFAHYMESDEASRRISDSGNSGSHHAGARSVTTSRA